MCGWGLGAGSIPFPFFANNFLSAWRQRSQTCTRHQFVHRTCTYLCSRYTWARSQKVTKAFKSQIGHVTMLTTYIVNFGHRVRLYYPLGHAKQNIVKGRSRSRKKSNFLVPKCQRKTCLIRYSLSSLIWWCHLCCDPMSGMCSNTGCPKKCTTCKMNISREPKG